MLRCAGVSEEYICIALPRGILIMTMFLFCEKVNSFVSPIGGMVWYTVNNYTTGGKETYR